MGHCVHLNEYPYRSKGLDGLDDRSKTVYLYVLQNYIFLSVALGRNILNGIATHLTFQILSHLVVFMSAGLIQLIVKEFLS